MKRSQWMGCLVVLAITGAMAHTATIEFSQLDWRDNLGGYSAQDSEYGQATIALDTGDASAFAYDGYGYVAYVNVSTTVAGGATDNWAVENFPVYVSDTSRLPNRLADNFWFDLGTARGADVTALQYQFSLTSTPLGSAPTGSMGPAMVVDQAVLFGGLAGTYGGVSFEGGSGNTAPVAATNTRFPWGGEKNGGRGEIQVDPDKIPAVDEDNDGCAPGAAARSLAYLSMQDNGVKVHDGPQKSYEELYDAMDTNQVDIKTTDPVTGVDVIKKLGGTMIDSQHPDRTADHETFKSGKDSYTSAPENVTGGVETKTGIKDVDKVIEALNRGHDVEMCVWWGKNAAGKSLGGHCAFVLSVQKYVDSNGKLTGYEVRYMDDGDQGDGVAKNDQHHLIFDADGKLIPGPSIGTGARLMGFCVETPEPGTLAMLAVGAVAMLRRRKR